ncbi:MBL fold metallo-hydrolase [Nisaea sediminum]|uniref:MBL fold metallo-hydrolase n=1 Tax=Nisaea sediminum TaxID=2775867 RepID=UPI0018667F91|nr:MBL fold metallo-hydrolase [Nisaea sediminum]
MATVIPFDRTFDPPYGVVERLGPGLRRIVARNPGPFTFRGTATFIVGEGDVAVIDPGPDLAGHIPALLDGLGNEKVSHILVTHTHLDHSPAAAELKARTGAPTYGYGPHGSGPGGIETGGDPDFIPDVRIGHGDAIEGKDWRLEALHTPGHTSNHLAFAWPERSILFPGDLVMGWSTSVISPPDGHMGDYLESLRKVLGRDEETYWPTHGGPIRDPKPFVEAFIAHRRDREEEILACLRDGIETISDMVPVIYADVPPAVHGAAARSLLAALIYLVETGQVQTDGLPDEESAYFL